MTVFGTTGGGAGSFGGRGSHKIESRDVVQLLVEIRDAQREHLAEYRRVAEESLALSRRAVQRQEQLGRLYQRALAVSAAMMVGLGLFLAWTAGAFR